MGFNFVNPGFKELSSSSQGLSEWHVEALWLLSEWFPVNMYSSYALKGCFL